MWLKLHYNDNGAEVLVNMDNIVSVSNRARDPIEGEMIIDHTILTSPVSQIHVKETMDEIYDEVWPTW